LCFRRQTWEFSTDSTCRLRTHWTLFDTESLSDTVTLSPLNTIDGGYASITLSGRNWIPADDHSAGSSLTLYFFSDSAVQYTGFRLYVYTETNPNLCPASPTQTGYVINAGSSSQSSTRSVSCASGYTGSATYITCLYGTWSSSTGCTTGSSSCSTSPSQTGYVINAGGSSQSSTRSVSCASGYTGSATSITCYNGSWSQSSGCRLSSSTSSSGNGFSTYYYHRSSVYSSYSPSISTGAIVGIVIGVLVLIIAVVFAVCCGACGLVGCCGVAVCSGACGRKTTPPPVSTSMVAMQSPIGQQVYGQQPMINGSSPHDLSLVVLHTPASTPMPQPVAMQTIGQQDYGQQPMVNGFSPNVIKTMDNLD